MKSNTTRSRIAGLLICVVLFFLTSCAGYFANTEDLPDLPHGKYAITIYAIDSGRLNYVADRFTLDGQTLIIRDYYFWLPQRGQWIKGANMTSINLNDYVTYKIIDRSH